MALLTRYGNTDCLAVWSFLQLPQQSSMVPERLSGDVAEASGANHDGGCSCGMETVWTGEPRKQAACASQHVTVGFENATCVVMYVTAITSCAASQGLRLLLSLSST